MNRADVDYLCNGCDAGREGELIFQRVYDLCRMQETGEAFMDQFHGRYGNPDRFVDK